MSVLNKVIILKKNIKNDVVYYTFNSFDRFGGIRHCFSTKIGGVSKGCYSQMNLSFSRGDSREDVLENFVRISEAVGFSHEDIVLSDQVHDVKIMVVGALDRGKGISRENDIKHIDGLMTDEKNVVLTTQYADCVPLYFYDTDKKAIAASHAGWRGTLNKIGEITVNEMVKKYNSNPKDIIVGIGPSIGKCCFEVDEPVVKEFRQGLDFADEFITASDEVAGKYHIDLWEINKQILINCGIKEENIEISDLCTKCNSDVFYSHRVCGADRGSLAAFLEII